MGVEGNTRVCDIVEPADDASSLGAALPMSLIVVSGGIPGAILRLTPGGTRLGRGADNTYQLQELCISRHHAVLRADPQGEVWLTDLGTTNGTYLNGRRLESNTPSRVKDGDRIQLGSAFVVKFVRLDPSEARLQRELFERSVRDDLTNLYNRSFFLNQVGAVAELGAMRGLGLAILMLDIDHLQQINETHGHEAGDAVLREVSAVLRDSTRAEDLVARYGGEEFILALPVTAPDLATERAERIRTRISGRAITVGGSDLHVTASLGLAYAPPGLVRSTTALITAADHCLYHAKRTGRDRLVFRNDPQAHAHESQTGELDPM